MGPRDAEAPDGQEQSSSSEPSEEAQTQRQPGQILWQRGLANRSWVEQAIDQACEEVEHADHE
eukprot:2537943-Alexandrium_andersonii.AAC.1